MGKIFYQLFLFFYPLGIKIAFNWNKKARQWIEGRKQLLEIAKEYHARTVASVLDIPDQICIDRNMERSRCRAS